MENKKEEQPKELDQDRLDQVDGGFSGTIMIRCPICGATFSTPEGHLTHMMTDHPGSLGKLP